jgi:hypothetical protein
MISFLQLDPTTQSRATPIKYPYLGKFPNGDVVLFIHRRRGICVHGAESYLGEYSYRWDEAKVTQCDSPVVLENTFTGPANCLPRFKTDSVYC